MDSPGAPLAQRGKGKEIGKTSRSRALGGETPMGAATYRGQGFKERRSVSGERPIGAAS